MTVYILACAISKEQREKSLLSLKLKMHPPSVRGFILLK